MPPTTGIGAWVVGWVAHVSSDVRTTDQAFEEVFTAFLVLGTIVGVVVISYMIYNAVKYRAGNDGTKRDTNVPEPGELETGGQGGRKLFLSFGLSAIIVVSLIAWTYFTFLYIDEGPQVDAEDEMDVTVTGFQFGWRFTYPNGHSTTGTLRVPERELIHLRVTSDDVFHNFGIPEYRVKTDAIPGQTTETWFVANETGTSAAACYELCGTGHSFMTADVVVMEGEEFESWYSNTTEETA